MCPAPLGTCLVEWNLSHISVREALRDATEPAHARVDAAFSSLDMASREGRAAFLAAQASGLEAALELFAHEPLWSATVHSRITAARRGTDARLPVPDLSGCDPLGAAYVVAGSLHGTGVLRARLRRMGVTPMPAFFESDDWKPMWRDVLARLDAVEAARLPALIAAADATFGAFHSAVAAVRVEEAA